MALRAVLLAVVVACALALAAPAAAQASQPEISGVAVHPWRLDQEGQLPFWPLRDPAVRERSFDALRAAGVRRARVDLRWNVVESHLKGLQDWSEFDAIHDTATEHGIKLLPMVAFTPCWANAACELWAPPDNPKDFEDFLAAAMQRYPDIDVWEIWNEPNLGYFWRPSPDVAGFVSLLRAADAARDRVGSQATIASGGLSSTGQDPFAWFEEMARLGAFDHVDGFGIHPYSQYAPDFRKSFFLKLPRFHDRLVQLGRPNVGLWLTEFGSPNTDVQTGYGPPISPEEQAVNVGRAYALAEDWPWVRNLTWYELQEGCDDGANPECRFGLLHPDFSPKPALDGLRRAILGDVPRLRSETSLSAAAVRPRVTRRARARGRRARTVKRKISVTGAVSTAGSDAAAATVELTVSTASSRPRVVRRVKIRVRRGAYAQLLGSFKPGKYSVVARFLGTARHLPSESRAAKVRIKR